MLNFFCLTKIVRALPSLGRGIWRAESELGARGPGAAKRVRACEGMGILLSKIFGKLIGQKEVLGCSCRARLLTWLHAALPARRWRRGGDPAWLRRGTVPAAAPGPSAHHTNSSD